VSFGSRRLPALIKTVAFQGVIVSIVPFFIGHDMCAGGIVFTIVTLLIRGIIIPFLPSWLNFLFKENFSFSDSAIQPISASSQALRGH
jgi:hydrogenase-4 membrane subunit HyfE